MGADSQIRLWQASNDYITLSYASAAVHYQRQGEQITDRLGLVHRVQPPIDNYPVALVISVLAEELTMANNANAPTRRSVLEWLEYYFRKKAELVVYLHGATLMEGGGDLNRMLAYKAYIDELPADYFGSLPRIGNGPEMAEIWMHITEDGVFTDFGSLSSYSPYSPARP